MTERIHIEIPYEHRPTEEIPLDCNLIARERIMPHANPGEDNPTDVLKRLLEAEQLTYAQLGKLFSTDRGRIGVWVKRGNVAPPTYRQRALKRWKGWREQGRDPLHTPDINAKRGASVRAYYQEHHEAIPALRRRKKNKMEADRAQNPGVQENIMVKRGFQKGKGVVSDKDKELVATARANSRFNLLSNDDRGLLDARFEKGESLRTIAGRMDYTHPYLVSLSIQRALDNLR